MNLEFRMKIVEIPYSGISDTQSQINIISLLKPGHVILINGGQVDNLNMRKKLTEKKKIEIESPEPGDIVEIIIENTSLDIFKF